MKRRLLYATLNPAKAKHMRDLLASLPLEIVSLTDLRIDYQIPETGETPAENACQKADFAFTQCGMPAFAVDSGLYIADFPVEKQPGLFVRRIYDQDRAATDEEMLRYYRQELDKIGGRSKAAWVTAIALRTTVSELYCETFTSETVLTSAASRVVVPGEPLNALQIDPVSRMYYSEMSSDERIKAQGKRAAGMVAFMRRHLQNIEHRSG